MREDTKVRITRGEYEGQTGTVIGPIRVVRGFDSLYGEHSNNAHPAPLWVIEFADGSQYAFQESELEVIDD